MFRMVCQTRAQAAATAYPAAAAQTAYVQPAQPTAYAAAPRPQAYETYQSTHTSGQPYAYATRTQVAAQPAATYDANKTYYAQTAAAPAAAQAAVYTVADASYNAAKPVYTSTTFQSPATVRPTHTQKTTTPVHSTSGTYTYQPSTTSSSATTTYTGNKSQSYIGYDAAVYSAATSYYQQQQTKTTTGTSNSWQNKKPFMAKTKPKQPPKQNQLHYCEVCKISCAGPQTYREHLEGQKHKKKEASSKGATVTPPARGMNTLRCELCDVACTGADAYAAHIRGSKHLKVLKLHTKLGKPIPSTEPVVVAPGSSTTSTTASKTSSTTTKSGTTKPGNLLNVSAAASAAAAVAAKKVVATPKITFVGGTQLKSTGGKAEEIKSEIKTEAVTTVTEEKVDPADILIPGEKDVVPVGQEYIEEVRNEFGNVVSFHCKLCECKFNDPNAKIMHMKGRRHRLQYKKKVDPSLQVEVKPSIRARKLQEEKLRRQAAKEEYWRRRDAEERWRMEWEQRRYEEEIFRWQGHGRGGPGGPFGPGNPGPMALRRPDTSDDRHVMAKHAAIYPTELELQAVQNIVSSCEKALKLVSDNIADIDAPKPMDTDKKTEKKEEKKADADKKETEKEDTTATPRALKGVMRVGVLAKGLLLHEDLNVKLVVLCLEKPTRTILERIADSVPKRLAEVSEDKFEVKMCVEKCAVIVSSAGDKESPKATCTITLTSPIMRDENTSEGESVQSKPDPPDVLDRQQCLDALAALRHAKWFQARANGLQSCVVVIRILRDLCQRVPTWTPVTQWAMELLAEKCVSSGGSNMSPGDALRRVFECIASGILLPGGPGLYDPCEKEPTDAAAMLINQEREDITASAQHALRLIAFRQIHKVLGMDQLPTPKFSQSRRTNRKRRRTNSTGESTEGEAADGKKDKKEGESDNMEPAAEAAQQA